MPNYCSLPMHFCSNGADTLQRSNKTSVYKQGDRCIYKNVLYIFAICQANLCTYFIQSYLFTLATLNIDYTSSQGKAHDTYIWQEWNSKIVHFVLRRKIRAL